MRSPAENYSVVRNRWLIIAIVVILVSGIALTVWTAQREDNQLREELLTKSRLIESSISTREHTRTDRLLI